MNPRRITVKAPAKINLFLEILRRREDGYHTISTLFQTISLFDELEVSFHPVPLRGRAVGKNVYDSGDGIVLGLSGGDLHASRDNLIVRAAESFRKRFSVKGGFEFRLKKKIPVGAGLGGGSSDAAAALKACWKLCFPSESRERMVRELTPLAKKLGADVAFFLTGGLAEGSGLGDRIRPLKPPRPFWIVLVFPRVFVSTPWVYQRLCFPLTKRRSSHTLKDKLVKRRPMGMWASELFNRLEEVVLPRVPAVRAAKNALERSGSTTVLMSGSGSAVFGIVETAKSGQRVLENLGSTRWDAWLLRSWSE
ncbi:MAG TPA: 4-(cytidine 5'-diphospho)-2-C-methyl-D-erythritol kinase [Elusimicrobiota bacterium]|nr:4-(cytidine 5'-diphospho)-2-C-methyl-D-erythritol kinase [Elusimicrobiota bacterium]